MADDEQKLAHLKSQIEGHVKKSLIKEAVNGLEDLGKVTITRDLLQKTKLGIYVNQLRKGENEAIAKAAAAVLTKWKSVVLGNPGSNASSTSLPTAKEEEDAEKTRSSVISKRSSEGDISEIKKRIREDSTERPESPARSNSIVQISLLDYSVGDATRDKCLEMLVNALITDQPEVPPDELVITTAQSIEFCLFAEFGQVDTRYKTKFRSKYLNLKDKANPSLRNDLLNGMLSAKKFCSMTAAEMASDERKKLDAQLHDQNLKNTQVAKDTQAETDQFKCGRCHQRRCKYYQLQTRSADEPMTTFVTCVNCGNRWKFC